MTLFAQTSAEPAFAPPAGIVCEEAELVRQTLGGNRRAFDSIVATHQRRVFHFLRQMTRQEQDAEDLTQQTFIKAFRYLAQFDATRPILPWLLAIARRNALNHFRSANKWAVIPEETPSAGLSPARAAEERDQTENLWDKARQLLSRRHFEVLWLRFGEDLSTEETARVVGLTQTHVKVIVFRARRALMKGELNS